MAILFCYFLRLDNFLDLTLTNSLYSQTSDIYCKCSTGKVSSCLIHVAPLPFEIIVFIISVVQINIKIYLRKVI